MPYVRAVVDELRQRGVDAWVDYDRLEPGSAWRETMEDALNAASL
jgi:hypothetical protein